MLSIVELGIRIAEWFLGKFEIRNGEFEMQADRLVFEEVGEAEFVEGDGVLLLELGEVGFAVLADAVGAEGGDEAVSDFGERGGVGIFDVENADDIPSVAEADGVRGAAFGEGGDFGADFGLDGGLGDQTDFSAAGGAFAFFALVAGDGGEVGTGGFKGFGDGFDTGFGFFVGVSVALGSGDVDLGEAELFWNEEAIFAGVVGGLDFRVGGIAFGDFGDGLDVGFGDGTLTESVELSDNFGGFVPAGGNRFFEEDLLEDEGANGLAEKRGVALESGFFLAGEAGKEWLDLLDFDFVIANTGNDGVLRVKRCCGAERG